jgi:hypothetical protein
MCPYWNHPMRNFRPTHVAVNLLLIVALAIQPLAECLANVDCSGVDSLTTTFTCQGCGCCEVEHAADRCCCCSGPTQSEVEETVATGCCRSKHKADAKSESSSEELDDEPAEMIAGVAADSGLRSVCLCGRDSQPLSDSSPPRPTSENRDRLALGASVLDKSRWNLGPSLATSQYAADLSVPQCFSQVILCVWRL